MYIYNYLFIHYSCYYFLQSSRVCDHNEYKVLLFLYRRKNKAVLFYLLISIIINLKKTPSGVRVNDVPNFMRTAHLASYLLRDYVKNLLLVAGHGSTKALQIYCSCQVKKKRKH